MSKVCFFDIDGTIVGHSRRVTDENKAALRRLRENGHLSILCTGRALSSINSSIKEVGFDGIIASAGSYISFNNEVLHEHSIDPNVLLKIIYLFTKNKIMFALESRDYVYQSPGVKEFFDARFAQKQAGNLEAERMKEDREFNASRRMLSEFNGVTPVAKVTFICDNREQFEEVREYVEEDFHVVEFSKPEDTFYNGEIILKNHTKGDGVKFLAKHLNIDIADTIAFGDSMNDYQMLEVAGESYVSVLSADNLKAISDGTFEDPDDNGMAKKLKELGLI